MISSLGRSGSIRLAVGATAGLGLIAFLIYKKVSRRRSQQLLYDAMNYKEDGPVLLLESAVDAQVPPPPIAVLGDHVVQLLELQMNVMGQMDEMMTCVEGLYTMFPDSSLDPLVASSNALIASTQSVDVQEALGDSMAQLVNMQMTLMTVTGEMDKLMTWVKMLISELPDSGQLVDAANALIASAAACAESGDVQDEGTQQQVIDVLAEVDEELLNQQGVFNTLGEVLTTLRPLNITN